MGELGRANGTKGDIVVHWHGEYVPRAGDILLLQKPGETLVPMVVRAVRFGKHLVLSLDGISDRTAAEKLTGAAIFMDKGSLPPPDPDACYLADLIGSKVYTVDGQLLGRLDHYEFPAGQVVWSIKDELRREILFPAMPCFIQSLDAAAKKAVIAPPPGLLDVYRA